MVEAADIAVSLIYSLEAEFIQIVLLSLRISLSAALIAFLLALPLATLIATRAFAGRGTVLVAVNAFQGLPPVVVGLVVYLLLSRAGPLGSLGLLFTPTAMILAQTVLALPLAVSLLHRHFEAQWREVGDALTIDGAPFFIRMRILIAMGKPAIATIFLATFGRAIAEVGAIMIVGGNIRGHTRTMTTAIALETSKGDLALALALGMVLVALTVMISLIALYIGRDTAAR